MRHRKIICVNGHNIDAEGRYVNGQCRACVKLNARNAEQRKSPSRRHEERVAYQILTRYGINSIEERDAILASQGNACAICRRTGCTWGKGFKDVWHIDHDPAKPGTYRGILCAFCNTALGRLEKFLPAVTQYLRRTEGS